MTQDKNIKCSSVLALHDINSNCLILTKRSEHLRHHPGEICFPGGIQEDKDKDLYATAVREVHEELGIEASRIQLVKELPVQSTLLGMVIHPWFARIETINPYKLNTQEVVKLIAIPMDEVLNPKNYHEFTIIRYGKPFQSWQFLKSKDIIWGATARIMHQLSSA